MYLILIILWELRILYRSYYSYSFYFLCFFLLLYYLWWSDNKEYTGERKWEQFRKLRIWKWLSPVSYFGLEQPEMSITPKKLFVVLPCATPMPLIWAFGLHGGSIPDSYNMTFVLPCVFFYIPILRDVLMWMGAVTYRTKDKVLFTDMLTDLFAMNRSVCWACSDFADIFRMGRIGDIESQSEELTGMPSDEILEFCRKNHICIVPVVVLNERQRYTMLSGWLLRRVQEFTYQRWGYPIPLPFWIKIWDKNKAPSLVVQWGSMIHCGKYENCNQIAESFKSNVAKFRVIGDKSIKPC